MINMERGSVSSRVHKNIMKAKIRITKETALVIAHKSVMDAYRQTPRYRPETRKTMAQMTVNIAQIGKIWFKSNEV